MTFKEQRDQAMRELREWNEKKQAERAAKGETVTPPVYPTEAVPGRVNVKWVGKVMDTPESVQDFDFEGTRSQLLAALQRDAAEHGLYSFVVLDEGGVFAVWRSN